MVSLYFLHCPAWEYTVRIWKIHRPPSLFWKKKAADSRLSPVSKIYCFLLYKASIKSGFPQHRWFLPMQADQKTMMPSHTLFSFFCIVSSDFGIEKDTCQQPDTQRICSCSAKNVDQSADQNRNCQFHILYFFLLK